MILVSAIVSVQWMVSYIGVIPWDKMTVGVLDGGLP